MNSSISVVVVKSDRLRRKVPKVGEQVRLEGEAGLWAVARVDREHRMFDAARVADPRDLLKDVPFKRIREVDAKTFEAVQAFLKSRSLDS